MGRIRILLVDDKLSFADDLLASHPRLSGEWTEDFELEWIQNSIEGRFLLDAIPLVAERARERLLDIGLPPEMLIFDFALTHGQPIVRTAGDPTDVASRLRTLLPQISSDLVELEAPPPQTGTELGKDRTGCYLGVELARAFSLHPCGAVPTTAHVNIANTDAAFYAWLNARYFSIPADDDDDRGGAISLFRIANRETPTWEVLIPLAAKQLRNRMLAMAGQCLLRMDLTKLQQLVESPSPTGDLTIHSHYGRRELSIKGLFADCAQTDNFQDEARKWASKSLCALFAGHGEADFVCAMELADTFFRVWNSEIATKREQLTLLATQSKRSAMEDAMLDELCERFGVSPQAVRANPKGVKVTKDYSPTVAQVAENDVVARWTVLMLIVRLEIHFRSTGIVMDSDSNDCEGDLEYVESELGSEEVSKQVASRVLRVERDPGSKVDVVERRERRLTRLPDVLTLLEPAPERLLLWFRARFYKDSGTYRPDGTFVTNPIKRLGLYDKGWGTLGVSVEDILRGRPFDCEICRAAIESGKAPQGDDHKEKKDANDESGKKYSHGLRSGEGQLLRLYADTISSNESTWPPWLVRAP